MVPHQHKMTADIERGRLARQPYRIVEGCAIGHQRSGGENTAAVRVHNSAVHIGGETEIVRVDYQLFARTQNICSWIVRNFLGLARMSFTSDCASAVVP